MKYFGRRPHTQQRSKTSLIIFIPIPFFTKFKKASWIPYFTKLSVYKNRVVFILMYIKN